MSFRIAARLARSVSVGAANDGSMGVEVNISPVLCVLLVSFHFITDEKLSHLQVGCFFCILCRVNTSILWRVYSE